MTPNLSILEIAYPSAFIINNFDPFLQKVAERTPLIKKIIMKNIRASNISSTVLEKLYI